MTTDHEYKGARDVQEVEHSRRRLIHTGTALAAAVGVAAFAMPKNAKATSSFPSYLSVADYGATGNGVTDDTAAINSCLSAATDGSTIYFPKGSYKINSPLVISKSIKLTADYSDGTTLIFYQNTSGIVIQTTTGLSDVQITNLSLRGVSRVSGTCGIDSQGTALATGIGYLIVENVDIALFDIGIKMTFSQLCTISRAHSYFNNYGIYTKRCVSTKLTDCIFEGNLVSGVTIDGDAAFISYSCGTLISGCKIVGNGGTTASSGNIFISCNENFEISCSMIDVPNPSSTYDFAIFSTTRASISQCWVGASRAQGMFISSSSEIVISSNTIVTATSYGVALASSRNCVVNSNTFRAGGSTDILIYGSGSYNNIISSNMCLSVPPSGLPSIQETTAFKTLCYGNMVKAGVLLDPTSTSSLNVAAL
jgi:parallel beta-helix repeat protein